MDLSDCSFYSACGSLPPAFSLQGLFCFSQHNGTQSSFFFQWFCKNDCRPFHSKGITDPLGILEEALFALTFSTTIVNLKINKQIRCFSWANCGDGHWAFSGGVWPQACCTEDGLSLAFISPAVLVTCRHQELMIIFTAPLCCSGNLHISPADIHSEEAFCLGLD